MNCARYRKWIKGAALNSLRTSRRARLDAHLAECAECRGLLGTERQLAEAINLALTASVSALPSPDFAARLRIRLAEESERVPPKLAWVRSGWLSVAVAGVVALGALLAVMWPALRQAPQPQPVRQTARAAEPGTQAPVASLPSTVTDSAGAVVISSPAHARMRSATAGPEGARSQSSTRAEDNPPQFQVMVEPGQWRAILAAYRAAQTERVDANTPGQPSSQEEQSLEMKPIEIKPVVIAELYPYTSAVSGGR